MSVSFISKRRTPPSLSSEPALPEILEIGRRFGSVAVDVEGRCAECGHRSDAFVFAGEDEMLCPDCDLPVAV